MRSGSRKRGVELRSNANNVSARPVMPAMGGVGHIGIVDTRKPETRSLGAQFIALGRSPLPAPESGISRYASAIQTAIRTF